MASNLLAMASNLLAAFVRQIKLPAVKATSAKWDANQLMSQRRAILQQPALLLEPDSKMCAKCYSTNKNLEVAGCKHVVACSLQTNIAFSRSWLGDDAVGCTTCTTWTMVMVLFGCESWWPLPCFQPIMHGESTNAQFSEPEQVQQNHPNCVFVYIIYIYIQSYTYVSIEPRCTAAANG